MRERGLLSPPHSETGPHPVTRDQLKFPDTLINLLQAARPLLEIGHEKVVQLFAIFKDEVYPFYPCVSLDLGNEVINDVFSLVKDTSHGVILNVDVIDVEITKVVGAIALLLRDDTQSPLSSDLEGQLVWSVDSCFDQERPQVEDIVMATLLVR
jgi:Zn-finger protein